MRAGSREIESHAASAGFAIACRALVMCLGHALPGKA
jgi:hypothetical protein